MDAEHPTRRSMLSYLTGGGVAVGALIAVGALGRSCAPQSARITTVDLSDMQDGEARQYSFETFAQIIVRKGDTLSAFDARCPISPHYILMPPSSDGLIWCHHCTSRFNFDGEITKYWGDSKPGPDAPDLNAGQLVFQGLTISIAEDQAIPRPSWSSVI